MNLWRIDFGELYRRHLCRHSEFGINVLHLVAVAGIYLSLFGIAFALPGASWIIAAALTVYALLLARNIPVPLLLLNIASIALLLLASRMLPPISVWIYAVLIIVWHRFQVWHHRIYQKHTDMGEFDARYRKGVALKLLLAIYELPILLNYLVFDRKSWTA